MVWYRTYDMVWYSVARLNIITFFLLYTRTDRFYVGSIIDAELTSFHSEQARHAEFADRQQAVLHQGAERGAWKVNAKLPRMHDYRHDECSNIITFFERDDAVVSCSSMCCLRVHFILDLAVKWFSLALLLHHVNNLSPSTTSDRVCRL